MTQAAIHRESTQKAGAMIGAGARTDVEFWRSRQPSCAALPAGGSEPSWLAAVEAHLPAHRQARVLEVGVVPGHMLLHFAGQRGWACTGIDLSPTIHDVAAAFAQQDIQARFIQDDFMTWRCDDRFDVVYSCGFIEHFDDPQAVIEKHWQLVKPGGLMVLTVPILSPMQDWVRRVVYTTDRYREMTTSHNRAIMNLGALKRAVLRCEDADVVVARHLREMTVWFGPRSPGVRPWTRPLFGSIRLMERIGRKLGWSSGLFSPEVVVASRKSVRQNARK